MCGVCGVYNFRNREPVQIELLKSMAETMTHRGPDAGGFYSLGGVGLGHRRLSIIDLEGGSQPMTNEDGTIWIAFNGEIYNFLELRDPLVRSGHVFKTVSDTETIIHLYEEYGEECFRYLRGMFAIVIWDSRVDKLIMARDRVGKKPLFYAYDGSRIVFASEIKAILKVKGIDSTIDIEAFSDYLSLLYIPNPKSIFKGIKKIRPGHYIVVSGNTFREVQYWDIHFSEVNDLTEEEWCERLLEAYREAVRIRLVSDVPLGAFLSGGVDSSSVVALMSEVMDSPVITSSIGFEEEEFNELKYARIVADSFRTDHHEEIVRPDAVSVVEKLAWHYDEPFADSSAVPTYYVSKAARQYVTVALAGDGGDELFAGYRRYYFFQRENVIRNLFPSAISRILFGTLARVYPKADWAPKVLRAKATFESLSHSEIEGYFHDISAFRPELKLQIIDQEVKKELGKYDTIDILRQYFMRADTNDPLSRIQYVDIKTYLTDDILVKVDRASMATSLEVRAPILDHKFMELAASIPASLKLRKTSGKYIFKKALKPILPEIILNRSKMGFGVPLADWFRGDLKEMAYDTIFGRNQNNYFNQNFLKLIWKQHQSGLRNRSTELWVVLMFRLWERQFMA